MNNDHFEKLLKETVGQFGGTYFENDHIPDTPHTFPQYFKADIEAAVQAARAKRRKFYLASLSAAAAVIAAAVTALSLTGRNQIPIDNTQKSTSAVASGTLDTGSFTEESSEYGSASEFSTIGKNDHQNNAVTSEVQDETVPESSEESIEIVLEASADMIESNYNVTMQVNGSAVMVDEVQAEMLALAIGEYITCHTPERSETYPINGEKEMDEIYIRILPNPDTGITNAENYTDADICINSSRGYIDVTLLNGEKKYFTFDDTQPIYQTVMKLTKNQ